MSAGTRNVRELFDLSGRVAVVTGGAGNYGGLISSALAEAGAHVVIASRSVDACSAYAAGLTDEGLSASGRSLDVTSEESVVALRDAVMDEYGRLDILVNAAVDQTPGSMELTTKQEWETAARVNSVGLFLMTRHCAQPMCSAGSGSIINISSVYGIVAPDFALYGQAPRSLAPFYAYDKGGMASFTRYVASAYGPYGIRANCISPGGLSNDARPADFVQRYADRTMLGGMVGRDDIKGAVVFLASDAAAFVTGVDLPVDGGWTAR